MQHHLILNNAPGQYCIGSSTVSGLEVTVDCGGVPANHSIGYVGYAFDGAAPCSQGPMPLCPIPVELQEFTVE